MTIDSNLERKSVTSLPFKQFLAQLGVNEIHGLETLRLIKMCANAYETVASEHLRTEQISEQRWRLLLRLLLEEQHGNPHVNPTHLANTQQVSKNTISSLLRSLEEQGLIERTLDQQLLDILRIVQFAGFHGSVSVGRIRSNVPPASSRCRRAGSLRCLRKCRKHQRSP